MGKQLVWDVTVVDAKAPNRLNQDFLWKWDSLPKPILPNSAKRPYLAHFAEFFSAKWASKFGKVGIEIRQSGQGSCLHLRKQTF